MTTATLARKLKSSVAHPIPEAALDDRLAFVGTSGSGKSYNAGTAIERLLHGGARAIIADPLGVWWGLRLMADGKRASSSWANGFDVVIFGGPHGDYPITENAGAIIGEAAATMAESCIVDLSEIGTAAGERRFMLGFLRALYKAQKATGELVHLVLDEADMWAPQTIRDKDGDANKLFAITERIIRRGRVDGFIPWMITQRPAELSKSVLSMAEGLIAMKLTSPQDRDALDAWIKGQADIDQGKRIKASLPSLQIGQGVVWVPGRGILLEEGHFPKKVTFDSSRSPKRGEKKRTLTLKPLDVGALKAKLATVEAEAVANDPAKLRKRIAELERQAKAVPAGRVVAAAAPAPSPAAIAAAEKRGYSQGVEEGKRLGIPIGEKKGADAAWKAATEGLQAAKRGMPPPVAAEARAMPVAALKAAAAPKASRPAPARQPAGDGSLTGPQLKLLGAIAWWANMGHEAPFRVQAAAVAGWKTTGSNLRDRLSELRGFGFVEDVPDSRVKLTPAGQALPLDPPQFASCLDGVRSILTGPQRMLVEVLVEHGPLGREELALRLGWQPGGSNIRDRLSELRTRQIIQEDSGVDLQPWVRQ